MIITNNPDVHAQFPDSVYIDCNVQGILEAVRDQIHLGAVLISHPLAGSLKPGESPYKSIAIAKKSGPVDYKSLQTIEDAITTANKFPEKNRHYNASILADFRIIDLDLTKGVTSWKFTTS